MARVLHVDDVLKWQEVVRRVLAGHEVDGAGSYDEALHLLQGAGPYDAALIDLHLVGDHGDAGGELLELLRVRYPDTRRLVVATVPPNEATRVDLAERYEVEEVLLKSDLGVPGLRRVIEEWLAQAVPMEAHIRRVELRRRYRDWQRRRGAQLDARIRAAELHAASTTRAGADARRRSRVALEDARDLRERFSVDCADVAGRIGRAVTVRQVLDAADAFEHLEGIYADQPRRPSGSQC